MQMNLQHNCKRTVLLLPSISILAYLVTRILRQSVHNRSHNVKYLSLKVKHITVNVQSAHR